MPGRILSNVTQTYEGPGGSGHGFALAPDAGSGRRISPCAGSGGRRSTRWSRTRSASRSRSWPPRRGSRASFGSRRNEHPLGPSPRVIQAIADEARQVHLYPDGTRAASGRRSRRAWPSFPSRSSSATAPTSCSRCWPGPAFEPGDEVVVPHPSFEPYATVVAIAGADLSPARLRVRHRPRRHAASSQRTDQAVILCSPHNPTGRSCAGGRSARSCGRSAPSRR